MPVRNIFYALNHEGPHADVITTILPRRLLYSAAIMYVAAICCPDY